MFYNSGFNLQNRIIIFTTNENIKTLSSACTWLADGTFKIVPSGFSQLLTVHCFVFGKRFAMAYILMYKKNYVSYVEAFSVLKKLCVTINIQYFVSDFELALVSAANFVFENVKLCGCNFHFSQICWRKIQELGHTKIYKEEKLFKSFVKHLLALAYFPIRSVMLGCKILKQKFENELKKTEFINIYEYFVNHWNIENVENVQSVITSVSFWSVYERCLCDVARTKNSLEGWHRSLNSKTPIPHPNLAKFVNIIQRDEQFSFMEIQNLKMGKKPVSISKNDCRVKNVVLNFNYYKEYEYFEAILSVVGFKLD
jgi:hypothetical protein